MTKENAMSKKTVMAETDWFSIKIAESVSSNTDVSVTVELKKEPEPGCLVGCGLHYLLETEEWGGHIKDADKPQPGHAGDALVFRIPIGAIPDSAKFVSPVAFIAPGGQYLYADPVCHTIQARDSAKSQVRRTKRELMMARLEGAKRLVNENPLTITDDERAELATLIDANVQGLKYGRYRVVVLGAFSAGKSTLINAMIGCELLPKSDIPTTAIVTELAYCEKPYFFIPCAKLDSAIVYDFKQGLKSLDSSSIQVIDRLEFNGENMSGVGFTLAETDFELLREAVLEITAQTKRDEEPFSQLKTLLDCNHDIRLCIGLPLFPEWMRDIVLVDAPGSGSIEDTHEIVIQKIIPQSQLVLYVVESNRTGAAIDRDLCHRISRTYRRKVFYVLNKIDTQDADERRESEDEFKRCIPNDYIEKPELLPVSALYAVKAASLNNGRSKTTDVLQDKKINLTELLINTTDWKDLSEGDKARKMADYLLSTSEFLKLRGRIETYLRKENKELCLEERARDCLKSVVEKVKKNCDETIASLESDNASHIKKLKEKREELKKKQEDVEREIRERLNSYKKSVLSGNGSPINDDTLEKQFKEKIEQLILRLKRFLSDETRFKQYMKPEPGDKVKQYENLLEQEKVRNGSRVEEYEELLKDEKEKRPRKLEAWIRSKVETLIGDVVGDVCDKHDVLYAALVKDLTKILQRVDAEYSEGKASVLSAATLKIGSGLETKVGKASYAIGTTFAGLTAGAVILSGAMTTTSTVTVAGTGAAGWLAAHGWMGAAGWLALHGGGTLPATSTIALLSGPVIVATIIGSIVIGIGVATLIQKLPFVKEWQIEKVCDKIRTSLEESLVYGTDENPSARENLKQQIRDSVEKVVKSFDESVKKYLAKLDGEMQNLINGMSAGIDVRKKSAEVLRRISDDASKLID